MQRSCSFVRWCVVRGFVCVHAFVWVLLFVQFILSLTDNLIHLALLLVRKLRHLRGEIPVKVSNVVNSQVQLRTTREHINAGVVEKL